MSRMDDLVEKIRTLPEERVAEVEDFVDFLADKARRQRAFDRLLSIAPALEAAGCEPLSEEEVLAEVKTMRGERRTSDRRAVRS